MQPVAVIFGEKAWQGYLGDGLLHFDIATTSGLPVRFIALHGKGFMFARRSWPDERPLNMEWLVHIVDIAERDAAQGLWQVIDREIDILIEDNLKTYHLLDLEDFGEAVARHEISPEDAHRLLRETQHFLDAYLHGESPFPPPESLALLDEVPAPQAIDLDVSAYL